MKQEKKYWLAWTQIKGLGSVTIKKIYENFTSLEEAWHNNPQLLLKIDGIGRKTLDNIITQKVKIDPDQLWEKHLKKNPLFWTPNEPLYPQLLLEIPSYPSLLYYQGKIKPSENEGITPLIGMVGTRQPTDHGKRWTYNISKALAQKGFTIVSGLAEGIDTSAHRGSLDGGGRTIAVLGNGLDRAYPPKNRDLMAEIAEKGLILTEYAHGSIPERGNFPARNRIVAGLCRAILVMEAPEKSGALITAHYATEFNRDVYTLPNTPDNLQARGCLKLIHKGAEVIITEEDLLNSLGAIPDLDQPNQLSLFNLPVSPPSPVISSPAVNLSPSLNQVLAVIDNQPTPFDVIVTKTGLNAGDVSGFLLELELEGLVKQLPGMMYSR
ncbi:MAG: DNA-protecting protein DprA [Cyanobacterium sp. T60_A2020_053]|nr:DNA-protecting protein DprA [Cyanobacterium sp. T60_A2020_053]